MSSLLEEIKKSKKYKHISEDIINKHILIYKKKNPKYEEFKEKRILKEIKAELHKIYGSFQLKSKRKREKFLEKGDLLSILKTNKSTKERLNDYDLLYKQIFDITGKPKKIIDLGSGINPVSYRYMLVKAEYSAYDIDEEDVNFLNRFFNFMNIKGKAEIMDISNLDNLANLPEADICFMFKVIDVIEKAHGKGHKLAEKIIKILMKKCKFIVVSFPLMTIGGDKMRHGYRGWVERMLMRNEIGFRVVRTYNEIFYIIGQKLNLEI